MLTETAPKAARALKPAVYPKLTVRERDCLDGIANGLRLEATAQKLGMCLATVKTHLSNARWKLEAETTTHAVARAVALGLITIR
jgi:DNA-binding NarL/FixJ family response regulator